MMGSMREKAKLEVACESGGPWVSNNSEMDVQRSLLGPSPRAAEHEERSLCSMLCGEDEQFLNPLMDPEVPKSGGKMGSSSK
jgi:hypothetical protein